MKPYPTRLRLDLKTDKTLNELSKSWGVSRSDIIRMAVRHACLCENKSPEVWVLAATSKKARATTVRFDLNTAELIDSLAFDYEPQTSRTGAIILAVRHAALCNSLTWPLADKPLPTRTLKKRYGMAPNAKR